MIFSVNFTLKMKCFKCRLNRFDRTDCLRCKIKNDLSNEEHNTCLCYLTTNVNDRCKNTIVDGSCYCESHMYLPKPYIYNDLHCVRYMPDRTPIMVTQFEIVKMTAQMDSMKPLSEYHLILRFRKCV